MSEYCEVASLITESDVEQKFIYKLLNTAEPRGLGYADSDIYTKSYLRGYLLGKGNTSKYYVPDYLIQLRGIPVLVVEAKSPNEDLSVAYAEARLYASEINAKYPHNINVCQKVIVSNGLETWAGYFDSDKPAIIIKFDEINPENKNFTDFFKFCSKENLKEVANKHYIISRGHAVFNTPVSELGGKRVQDEELIENDYGRTLILENRNLFNPETEEDRVKIVRNAYIKSPKREQHIQPMFKELKKLKLPSMINSTPLATERPSELIETLRTIDADRIPTSLMLLIGNTGSGKTTFIRYFKEMILDDKHPDIARAFEWLFLDMNNAPVDVTEIYDWLKVSIIDKLKDAHDIIKQNSKAFLDKLFKPEINEFENGVGMYIKEDKATYNSELYKIISSNLENKENYLKALFRYLKENNRVVPIIVLDNCDKLVPQEQLLMFQVAQWIRTNYKCVVLLPMRDSTYDMYKSKPPLDTVVKDLVFRIDPADFLKVIQARLAYISRLNEATTTEYHLANGIRIPIKKYEQIEYFNCILMAIRQNDWAKSVFYYLSNGNIREAIQLFVDFCRSGHIKTDDIFKIKSSGGSYEVPSYKIMNPLLRKNRKYYSDEKSNFSNLFFSRATDDFPDPFVRVDILCWLNNLYKEKGPNNVEGYHRVNDLVRSLQTVGHNEDIIFRELKVLIKRGLILSETQNENIEICDLIKISPAGRLHCNLLKNLSYLSACAEDVVYKNTDIMMKISKRIALDNYLDKVCSFLNARDMLMYLQNYKKEFLLQPEAFLKDDKCVKMYDLQISLSAIEKAVEKDKECIKILKNLDLYSSGQEVDCVILSKKNGGLLCHFGEDVRGFLAYTEEKFNLNIETYNSLNENNHLKCKILDYNFVNSSYNLEFVSVE